MHMQASLLVICEFLKTMNQNITKIRWDCYRSIINAENVINKLDLCISTGSVLKEQNLGLYNGIYGNSKIKLIFQIIEICIEALQKVMYILDKSHYLAKFHISSYLAINGAIHMDSKTVSS
jgi:hypothetical protein